MRLLLEYLNSLPVAEQSSFAQRCGTTVGYLRKAASVGQLFNPATCVRLELESGGVITRPMLRPDDWQDIWPELAGVPCADQNQPATPANQTLVAIKSEAMEAAHG